MTIADGIILSALLALSVQALRTWKRKGGCSGCRHCPRAAGCRRGGKEEKA